MVWIRRTGDPQPEHRCPTPMTTMEGKGFLVPDGEEGDLWACDECGKVWHVSRWTYDWWDVHELTQFIYRPRYTCGCKIGLGRKRRCRKRTADEEHGILAADPTVDSSTAAD